MVGPPGTCLGEGVLFQVLVPPSQPSSTGEPDSACGGMEGPSNSEEMHSRREWPYVQARQEHHALPGPHPEAEGCRGKGSIHQHFTGKKNIGSFYLLRVIFLLVLSELKGEHKGLII